jgi:hypothetical protein
MHTQRQLTFDVDRHPDLEGRDAILDGTLKIAGDLSVRQDLQPGERITITIGDADGNVISTAEAEIGAVAFVPIKLEGSVIGTDRLHKAKLV